MKSLGTPLARPLARPLAGSRGGVSNVIAPVITAADTLPGRQISVSDGGWLGSPDGFSYQWTRAGVPIAGATANTYTLTAADMARPIACRVTALPSGATAETAPFMAGAEFTFIFLPALDGGIIPRVGPTPTHSRASGAMYYDSTGRLRWADENTFLRSGDLTHSQWTKFQSSIVSGIADPNGGATAFAWTPNTNVSSHSILYGLSGILPGIRHHFQYWVKGDGVRYINFSAKSSQWVSFDTQTGLFGAASGVEASLLTFSASDGGNGWWKVTVSGIPGSNINIGITATDSLVNPSQTPSISFNGTDRLLVWRPSWNRGLAADSVNNTYYETVASAVYGHRLDHRYVGGQWVPQGYLSEGQRVNLLQQSTDLTHAWWTLAAVTTSASEQITPEGIANGFRVTETATTASHYLRGADISYTANQFYAASVFAKQGSVRYVQIYLQSVAFSGSRYANFDLQTGTVTQTSANVTAFIEPVGNGWHRLIVVSAASATTTGGSFYLASVSSGTAAYNLSHAGNTANHFHACLPQMEQINTTGGGASTPIPTRGATATRSADVALGDISSVGIETAAAVAYAVTSYSTNNTRLAYQCDDGTNANRFAANMVGATQVLVANALHATLVFTPSTPGVEQRTAASFFLNDVRSTTNGVPSVPDASCPFPPGINRVGIGCAGTSVHAEGTVRALLISNGTLTDPQLQLLSTNL